MRKGVIILRPPTATHELRSQVVDIMSARGWLCAERMRFDGVVAVAVELPADAAPSSVEELEGLLRRSPLLAEASLEIKVLE